MDVGLGKGIFNKQKQLVALTEKAGHQVVAGNMDVDSCAGHLARNPRRARRLIPHGGRSSMIGRWTPLPIPPFASSSTPPAALIPPDLALDSVHSTGTEARTQR
jgi:hypothetical protein